MPPRQLTLAPDLRLPATAVTEPIGIFANRGKGKSNAAHLLVEQLFHAKLPAWVLDWKGDWWGILGSSDGKQKGLPFAIFGGDHGHVPLDPKSGAQIAELLVELRIPAILDLSHFSKTQARTWTMEFAERLYRINRDPAMLVVDEADVLIPQRLSAELMRLIGAMEDIAKRGRQRGLGIVVISQRVQDVNKSVTDLLETLLIFCITGYRMRKAVLDWIDDHGEPEEAKTVIATLSTLEPGECWVWSPSWLKILVRVMLNRIETFDSHYTPEPGVARKTMKTVADVDLGAITVALAETIERAKGDDPKELRKQLAEKDLLIAEFRAYVNDLPTEEAEPVEVEVEVEVPVPVPVRGLDDNQLGILRDSAGILTRLGKMLPELVKSLESLPAEIPADMAGNARSQRTATAPRPRAPVNPGPDLERAEKRASPRPARPVPQQRAAPVEGVTGPEQRIVDAIAWWETAGVQVPSRAQIAVVADYHPRTKSFTNSLSSMHTAGAVTYPKDGHVALADLGRQWAQYPSTPATTTALREMIYAQVKPVQSRVLRAIVEAGLISRVELAEKLDYHERTKSYTNTLSFLRSMGFIDYPEMGWLQPSALMYVPGR